MTKDLACRMARAFCAGLAFSHGAGMALDAAQWITVHPNGKGGDKKGRPALIDSETGAVLGGMGGKFNGKKISEVKSAGKAGGTAKTQGAAGAKGAGRAKIDLSHPAKIDKANIIQNRNRATLGSIQQIQSIAAHPDYFRMGTSHDMANGAPVVAYGSIPENSLGHAVTVVDADGNRYKMQYAVVEAKDVLTSNNALGQPNDEYQSDDASKIRAIAGNGRMAGITAGYEKGTAEEYKRELIDDAAASGVDPAQIKKMKNPVLVRVMQASDITKDIGDRSNKVSGLSMTAVERANNDKQRTDLGKVETYEDGTPTIQSLQNWIGKQPVSEQGELIGKNGAPTKQAMERYQAAIFSKAYDNDTLTEMYGQALDPDCKTIISGLERAAVKMANLGNMPDGYDIRDIIGMATEKAVKAKQAGQSLEDAASQTDIFNNSQKDDLARAIVGMYAKNSRSGAAIGKKLSDLADALAREGNKQDDLFGPAVKRPPKEIFKEVLSQDRKPGKMSAQMQVFWQKRGAAFLNGFFSGVAQDHFFKALSQAAKK